MNRIYFGSVPQHLGVSYIKEENKYLIRYSFTPLYSKK